MNFMWHSSSNAPYHLCHIDAICNPYKYTRFIKSTWASYVNATRVISFIRDMIFEGQFIIKVNSKVYYVTKFLLLSLLASL